MREERPRHTKPEDAERKAAPRRMAGHDVPQIPPDSFEERLKALEESASADRALRRAALNLMEDAVEARRAEQEEAAERQRADLALREMESRQAFLLKVSDALRPLAKAEDIQNTACRMLLEFLRVNRVCYAEIEGDEFVVRASQIHGVSPFWGRGPVEIFGTAIVEAHCRRGEVVAVPDVAEEARLTPAERSVLQEKQVGAFAGATLLKAGEWRAALGMHSVTPRLWKEGELHLLRELAERVWAATERAQAEAALRESEIRTRHLVEGIAQAFWEADADGVVVTDSPDSANWRAYTGQTLEEWLGDGWLNAIHPEDRRRAEHHWHEAMVAKRGIDAEFRLRAPDGSYRWTNVRATPLLNEKGAIQKWVGMNIDIHTRKAAEEILRANEQRQGFLLRLGDALRPLADPAEVLAVACRMLGEYLQANRVGYAEAEDDGETIVVAHHYTHGVPGIEGRYRYADYGRALLSEFEAGRTVVRPDIANDPLLTEEEKRAHAALQLGATVNKPLLKSGRLLAVLFLHFQEAHFFSGEEVALVEEIGERTWAAVERVRAERALWAALQETEQARDEAQAASRTKDHFLAILSHELRTPLMPVVMSARMVERDKNLPPHLRDSMEIIQRNVQVEIQLITDLLDVTRMSRGKMELAMNAMDLRQSVERALEVATPDIAAKNQQVHRKFQDDDYRLFGDPTRLQQVFWNILKNAAKFTPDGGDITVRLRREEANFLVEFIDTGIGFEPAAAERLFEAFTQADEKIAREFGGLGLGLAIARGTVTGHGGKLAAISEGPGRGATFRVSLPLRPPEPAGV